LAGKTFRDKDSSFLGPFLSYIEIEVCKTLHFTCNLWLAQ